MSPRKHIPWKEKYAAALVCLLPEHLRNFYRDNRCSPDVIIEQFEVDHIVLHAFGGTDDWWNLDPILKPVHREKTKRDVGIVAKAKRTDKWWGPHKDAMAEGRKPPKRKSRWRQKSQR